MPGSVHGNAGTILEHVILVEVVRYVCNTSVLSSDSWVHYVDTHAMHPLNEPIKEEGLFRDLWHREIPAELLLLSPFFRIMSDAKESNPRLYPSHAVFAARSAQMERRRLWASLFEIRQEKWPEIQDLLDNPSIIAGLGMDVIQGTLGCGTFRDEALWTQANNAMAAAGVQPAARVVYCDPMSYALADELPRFDRMNFHDLVFLRTQLVDAVPTFFILFTNEQDRARFAARAEIYADQYAESFLPIPQSDHSWCMFRANNSAVFLGAVGFMPTVLDEIRRNVCDSLEVARLHFRRDTAIDCVPV